MGLIREQKIGLPSISQKKADGIFKISISSQINDVPGPTEPITEVVSKITFGDPIIRYSGLALIKSSTQWIVTRATGSNTENSINITFAKGSSSGSVIFQDTDILGGSICDGSRPIMSIYATHLASSEGAADGRLKYKWFGTTGSPTAGTVCMNSIKIEILVQIVGEILEINREKNLANYGNWKIEEL